MPNHRRTNCYMQIRRCLKTCQVEIVNVTEKYVLNSKWSSPFKTKGLQKENLMSSAVYGALMRLLGISELPNSQFKTLHFCFQKNAILDECSTVDSKLDYDGI